jgi:hypothetical protein
MTDEDPKKSYAWVETAGAILMAVSSLGTAWCSYEVSRWGAQSSGKAGRAGALERKANLLNIQGYQVQSTQAQMFMEYVAAHLSGNAALEKFYVDRFPPEVKVAFEAWIAQKPFENPSAPPHPFVPSLYERRFTKEIDQSLQESAKLGDEARSDGDVADRYLTNTVVLATVLFFIGITTRFSQPRLRMGTFFFGALLFTVAIIRVLTLPMRL